MPARSTQTQTPSTKTWAVPIMQTVSLRCFSPAHGVPTGSSSTAPEEIINATKLVLFPSVDGAVGEQNAVSGGAGWGWSIAKSAEGDDLKAAANFVYYLTNYDYATEALKLGYVRYPSKAPEGADFSNVGPVTQQYLDSLSSSSFCPDYYVLMESAPLETYGAVIQEIMIGTTTPEDGAKRIDDAYEQYVVNK